MLRVLIHMACVATAVLLPATSTSNSTAGKDGVDFIYYSKNATDSLQKLGLGVTLKGWKTKNMFDTVAARLELTAGASYPSTTGYSEYSCYVIVMEGSISFGAAIDNDAEFQPGELLWLAAGSLYGPIKAATDAAATILCDGEWSLFPAESKPASTAAIGLDDVTSLAYHKNTTTHTLPDAYRFAYPGAFALADSVEWAAGTAFPPHYHPRGSYYVCLTGNLAYGGDREGYVGIGSGDIRWVRPGWYYTAEFTTESSHFVALHTSTANLDTKAIEDKDFVSWGRPPPGPFVVQFQVTATRAFPAAWHAHGDEVGEV